MSRKFTNQLLEMLDEGSISYEDVAKECLSYMSEADVEDMVTSNGWIDEEEEAEEEEEKVEMVTCEDTCEEIPKDDAFVFKYYYSAFDE